MILSPRRSRTTVATTEAPLTVGDPTFGSSPPTRSTSLNVILSWSTPPRTSRSTVTVEPSSTRYCFPPVWMMAYTRPPKERDSYLAHVGARRLTACLCRLFRPPEAVIRPPGDPGGRKEEG